MSLPEIISLILFVAFDIYAFWGLYTLNLGAKRGLKAVFFTLCLLMCVWAFCLSIANSAPNYETALYWRRMAALGWGPAYGVMLHYFLVLTGKSELLKKRWIYLPLYLPGVLTALVFGVIPELASRQYNLVESPAGWVNISVNNWWDWFFNIYYLGFAAIGLVLLWQWGRSSRNPDDKKQAYLLMASFALAVILGTITDIIANSYMSFKLPQLAPVFVLIPFTIIFYFIKRYGLMVSTVSSMGEADGILSADSLAKLCQILTVIFVYGGILHFGALYYLSEKPFASTLSLSLIFIVIAIVLQIIQKAPISVNLKEIAFVLVVSIPLLFVILSFVEHASITVWAITLVVLIVTILFDNPRIVVLSGSVGLLTLVLVWMKAPTGFVWVDGADHLGRIGILLLAFVLAYYVNRLLIRRVDEIRDRIRLQNMVSQISANFMSATESNLDEKITDMLQQCGNGFRVEHSYFIQLLPEFKIYAWNGEGVESADDLASTLFAGDFAWWKSRMQKNDVVYISDRETLPPEATEEKAMLERHGIKSLFAVPVTKQKRNLGVLIFASIDSVSAWREDHDELLRILANLLTEAMARVEAEKEINYLAYYDGTTGLPNRTLFINRLEQSIHLARRLEKLIGVIFLDLDSFKAVNDTVGHAGGDEILKRVAERLSRSLRKSDTVARFGGDEFLISVNQISRVEDIKTIADNIMKTFAEPFRINGQQFFISASAGIAVFPIDGEEAEVLIKNADLAMYASKNKGKNQYTMCSPEMKEDMLKRMKLINGLYRALERNELELYYQPQISVITKEIIGIEALVRWNHPELGMMPPSTFIPLAEQTGLIKPIGQWVLETACRQNKEWRDKGLPPMRIAVNLSVEQFRDPELIDTVARVLNETGLEPEYLELEITENATSYDLDYIIPVLHELKKLGVSIAIDDFGTEYSSLSRLKVLPVDRLKIDMRFVQSIAESDKDEAIARTVVQLAKNLRLNVTAEGVETEKQFQFFGNQMCDEVQGFYFYKPMPAAELEAVLAG